MALQIPGFVAPQGHGPAPDLLSLFQKGYDFGGGISDERGAKDALGAYVASLYGGKPQAAQRSPGGDLILNSGNAAEAAQDPTLAKVLPAYAAQIAQRESGGSNTATNPNSSATGKYQFLTATWDDLAKQHPELGLTADGRTDPGQQDRAMMAFTADNARTLKGAGIPVNPATLYAAHFLGPQGATDVLNLPDQTPMATAVSPEVIQANPMLANMTVADFKQWTAKNGGNASGGYQAPMAPVDLLSTEQPGQAAGAPSGLPPRDVLAALFQNPVTRSFGAELVKTVNATGKPTDVQQNYLMALKQGYQGSLLDYQKELKQGAVTVNTGDNSSKFSNKADELAAGRLSDYVTEGNDAASFTGDMMELADLSKHIETGKKTQILAALGPYAEAMGIQIDGLDDAQAYQAIISRLAPKMRAPGSGSSSDTDVRMFLESLPNLGNKPGGNQIIIDTFRGVQKRKIEASAISQKALSGEISWQEADKQIAALGDPYTAFKKWQKDNGGGALSNLDSDTDALVKKYGQ